jgi:hypothetical protein
VLGRINQLCERLAAAGPGTPIDVYQAALRVTLDIIGLVSAPLLLLTAVGDHQSIHSSVRSGQD